MEITKLIELAKEIAATEDLSTRAKDVELLKKEANRIIRRSDADSFAEQKNNEEFLKYYNEIASKEVNFVSSVVDEKKALIAKAKALLDAKNYKKATEELNEIFEAFKETGRCDKEQDDALWAELKEVRSNFNKKKQEYFDGVKEAIENKKAQKEELIAEAKAALENTNFKEINNTLNELMEKWKTVGFAGKDNDEKLWSEFSAVRKAFYAKRDAYYDEMKKVFAEKAAQKEELIKKAKIILANSEFTEEEVTSIKELRNAWKEVGFAGKDKDDALWQEFNETVNKYFQEKKFYKNDK